MTSQRNHATTSILCLAGTAGLGNAMQFPLPPLPSCCSAVPLGHPVPIFRLHPLLASPHPPSPRKIDSSCEQFIAQAVLSHPYCAPPDSKDYLQRAQPEAGFGHGKCQVRHGELEAAVKSRVGASNPHLSQAVSSLATCMN